MAFCEVKKTNCGYGKHTVTTGQLINWECENRDNKTLKKILVRLNKLKVSVFFADNWKSYSELIPSEVLIQSKS